MIDLPPAGGGIRTRDLVVESRRVQDHWAIPVIPSKWYPKYPRVPKNKKKVPKIPSVTQNTLWYKKIGFGGSGPFCTFFDICFDPTNVRFYKNEFLVRSIN